MTLGRCLAGALLVALSGLLFWGVSRGRVGSQPFIAREPPLKPKRTEHVDIVVVSEDSGTATPSGVLLEGPMWFDGAGIHHTVSPAPVGLFSPEEDWALVLSFKSAQSGPLVCTGPGTHPAKIDMEMHGGQSDKCLLLWDGYVVFYTGSGNITSSRRFNDRKWHRVALTWTAKPRQLNMYIDGSLDASARGVDLSRIPSGPGKRSVSLGFGSDAFPPFLHTTREIVRLTIISRTYLYGSMANVRAIAGDALTLEHAQADARAEHIRLRRIDAVAAKAASAGSVRLDNTTCTAMRTAGADPALQSVNMVLVGNLRTFGSNVHAFSRIPCALPRRPVMAVAVTPPLAQHADRAWYMDKAETSGATPPSMAVLDALRQERHVCYPFDVEVVPEEAFVEALPTALRRPLDTDRDKAEYFSKLTFSKALYFRRALARLRRLHVATAGRELRDDDVVVIGRPDMRPPVLQRGLLRVAKALRQDPLRAFVQWHGVWGCTDMVLLTSVAALRRLASVDLQCAFGRPYLNRIFEPELQLRFLLHHLCIDVFLYTGEDPLMDWSKVTHEFDEIVKGLRHNGTCAYVRGEVRARVGEGSQLEAQNDDGESDSVISRPLRTYADAQKYGGLDNMRKLYTELGSRFCKHSSNGSQPSAAMPRCLNSDSGG